MSDAREGIGDSQILYHPTLLLAVHVAQCFWHGNEAVIVGIPCLQTVKLKGIILLLLSWLVGILRQSIRELGSSLALWEGEITLALGIEWLLGGSMKKAPPCKNFVLSFHLGANYMSMFTW